MRRNDAVSGFEIALQCEHQRMAVDELLNRWIIPLESRVDFLTLASGKKIQVPFEGEI